ncbi:hypothetical protein Pcinc_029810 [Petrolisthes cinctipes]|uniref:Uncharacterized protein n=1 Tax=Petrolisthes cinctipes TaxID=88211 RepID=A0AAE1K5C9_PETCI|nr:hypothetical protein Pcinc_029810 [Petrolisthes cinctipes]
MIISQPGTQVHLPGSTIICQSGIHDDPPDLPGSLIICQPGSQSSPLLQPRPLTPSALHPFLHYLLPPLFH